MAQRSSWRPGAQSLCSRVSSESRRARLRPAVPRWRAQKQQRVRHVPMRAAHRPRERGAVYEQRRLPERRHLWLPRVGRLRRYRPVLSCAHRAALPHREHSRVRLQRLRRVDRPELLQRPADRLPVQAGPPPRRMHHRRRRRVRFATRRPVRRQHRAPVHVRLRPRVHAGRQRCTVRGGRRHVRVIMHGCAIWTSDSRARGLSSSTRALLDESASRSHMRAVERTAEPLGLRHDDHATSSLRWPLVIVIPSGLPSLELSPSKR
jgi:hypothetical protein